MQTRKVYTIGETLLDIIFINNEPSAAKPGGSTLNSSISLGRLGVPVSFISEWGNDNVGNLIDDFLKKNNVLTENVYQYNDAQTIIAMAFLDENRNASYQFYKEFPKERLKISLPEIQKNDIVLFSSFFAINKEVRPIFLKFINKAKNAGAILIYDPNFRKTHSDEMEELRKFILENISLVDIVRGSDEDFKNIFGVNNAKEAFNKINNAGCSNLIYTANKNGVFVHSGELSKKYEVPQINPLSTIGAGDNFNAGTIYGLYKLEILKDEIHNLDEEKWNKIIHFGTEFATDVCMSFENYISETFANSIK